MASKTLLDTVGGIPTFVRLANPEAQTLFELLFSRYPNKEWATFARFDWREVPEGFVITLAAVDAPTLGDLDETVDHVAIRDGYTLRIALEAERHKLAVGVVHSHPEGYGTSPIWIDDDMDSYYADYFAGFATDRPYVSLIFAEEEGRMSATGRIFWRGRWHPVARFSLRGKAIALKGYDLPRRLTDTQRSRVARLESAFGVEAAERLANATVGIVGASGTDSPAIEALARAGVGHIIVVDPDTFSDSNLERLHGSFDSDCGTDLPKVELAKRHILSINPSCRVTAIQGSLPQKAVVDALCCADVVLGCTDKHHSRLALSDLSLRYLVPALDCGVGMEGEDGRVTGQVIQLVRLLPSDPCAFCQKLIVQTRLNQELISEEEREQRRNAAQEALKRGESGAPYWHEEAQLNTVGYLTTATGSMAAGFAIGWVTGRFEPPFSYLQMNLSQPFFDTTDDPRRVRQHCNCTKMRGTADQGNEYAFVTPPAHWPPAQTS